MFKDLQKIMRRIAATLAVVVEPYVSGQGCCWTILITLTNGISCIAAAGKNWMDATEQA